MRLLLILDPATRSACSDYFTAQGCTVDAASCVEGAEGLLRFRAYDAVIADIALNEMLHAAASAQRRNASTVPILLTTNGEWSHDARVVTMTKPVRLAAILETVGWGGQKSEIRKQKSESRNQKPETRNQKPETRNQKSEIRRAEGRRRKAEGGNQKSEIRRQKSEIRRHRR